MNADWRAEENISHRLKASHRYQSRLKTQEPRTENVETRISEDDMSAKIKQFGKQALWLKRCI